MDKQVTLADHQAISAQLRGETIAYALQSCITNIGANLFEPYVGYRVQQRYAKHGYGNYAQNLLGEFVGDVAGSGSLILAELVCPEQLHSGMRAVRRLVDPLYTTAAHYVLHAEKGAPDYAQQVDQWKTFQERNLVRSGIMATMGVAANIATQKCIAGNPAPVKIIFLGKLASVALTTALGLSVRLAFPSQMNSVDQWMGKQIAPLMGDVGIETAPSTHTQKLIQDTSAHAAPTR